MWPNMWHKLRFVTRKAAVYVKKGKWCQCSLHLCKLCKNFHLFSFRSSIPILSYTLNWPHYIAPHTTALAEGAGADRVQAGCCGIQMPTPDSSAVPCWGIPPVICWRGSSAHHRLLSDAPVFQPSATELYLSLLPDCGTLCRWTSRRRRQYLFSGNVWKLISSVILSLNLL